MVTWDEKRGNPPKCLLCYLKHLNALNVDDISVFFSSFFPKIILLKLCTSSSDSLYIPVFYFLFPFCIVLKLQYKINVTDRRPYFDIMFHFF